MIKDARAMAAFQALLDLPDENAYHYQAILEDAIDLEAIRLSGRAVFRPDKYRQNSDK